MAELFKKPDYGMNPDGYLCNKGKMVMVQIGRTFFALREWETVPDTKNASIDKMNIMLNTFDVRLLKEQED